MGPGQSSFYSRRKKKPPLIVHRPDMESEVLRTYMSAAVCWFNKSLLRICRKDNTVRALKREMACQPPLLMMSSNCDLDDAQRTASWSGSSVQCSLMVWKTIADIFSGSHPIPVSLMSWWDHSRGTHMSQGQTLEWGLRRAWILAANVGIVIRLRCSIDMLTCRPMWYYLFLAAQRY